MRRKVAHGVSRPSLKRIRYGWPVVEKKEATFPMKSSAVRIPS